MMPIDNNLKRTAPQKLAVVAGEPKVLQTPTRISSPTSYPNKG